MFTFNPRMPKSEDIRVVGVVPPQAPVWGVYYDLDSNKLYTKPVICFVAREFITRPGDVCSEVKLFPVMFNANQMVEESNILTPSGFLGLSEEAEPKKDAWNNEIRDFKKLMKRQPE